MRKTKQKELLESKMNSFETFFDSSDLFLKVKSSKIGIATVYRFLNDAVLAGRIHSFMCDRKLLYSNNKKNHCHFTCEKCGEKKHIDLKKVDFITKGDVCHFQLDVFGICEKCKVNR